MEIVKQKGLHSYEHMDNFKTFSKDELPDQCNYFSFLQDECICEKDCLHAINVWNVFKMNTVGDYHVLYLKKDVLFLAEVFEKLINKCLEYYGLDPCHYFSCLVLNWDAMLEMTGVELQPI